MNEMWGNAARSLFVENNGLALNTWKAANTRADRAARTQALSFAHISQPRIFKRLARRIDAEDDEEVHLPLHLVIDALRWIEAIFMRSEEHTSALQSLMRISTAVSCLKN